LEGRRIFQNQCADTEHAQRLSSAPERIGPELPGINAGLSSGPDCVLQLAPRSLLRQYRAPGDFDNLRDAGAAHAALSGIWISNSSSAFSVLIRSRNIFRSAGDPATLACSRLREQPAGS